jgi:hypothetical protein
VRRQIIVELCRLKVESFAKWESSRSGRIKLYYNVLLKQWATLTVSIEIHKLGTLIGELLQENSLVDIEELCAEGMKTV